MKENLQKKNARIYINECTRLLFRTYFRPFSSAHQLHDMQLGMLQSLYGTQELDYHSKSNFKSYSSQVRLLSVFVPLVVVLIVGLIYTLGTKLLFNWVYICLFLIGWYLGLRYTSTVTQRSWRILIWLIIGVTVFIGFLLWNMHKVPEIPVLFTAYPIFNHSMYLGKLLAPLTVGIIAGVLFTIAGYENINVAICITIGIVGCVAFSATVGFLGTILAASVSGTVGGIAFGVTRSTLGGLVRGITEGTKIAIIMGIVVGVAQSIIVDIEYGEHIGIAVGLAFGIALGAAFGAARGKAGNIVDITLDVVVGLVAGLLGSMSVALAGGSRFGMGFGETFGITSGIAWMLGMLRFHFWLIECLLMLIVYFRSRQEYSILWLRYVPPCFDDLIILPLPFIREFLVNTYYKNPSEVQRTLDYLIASTNQQRLVVHTIASITIEELNRCQTPHEISSIVDRLNWISMPYPKAINQTFPQFLEISQAVKSALYMSSFDRQQHELRKPIQKLRHVQQSLAGATTWEAITFGSIARRWQTILDIAQKTLEESAHRLMEIRQVYITGPALDPDMAGSRFKGRQDLFREIETLLLSDQPPPLLLYGGRRTGKTSVLKYLPRRTGPDIVPLWVDIQGLAPAMTLAGLVKELTKQIVKAAQESRNLCIPLANEQALSEDPLMGLLDWFRQLEQIIEGKRFLLSFDEFELLSEVVKRLGNYALLDFLRHVIQHRQRWVILLSGSHLLTELEPYWSNYLINARALRVSYLEEVDARDLIVHPIEDFPDIYTPEAVDTIIHLTHCQPYLIQSLCYATVELLNREKGQRATAQDVMTIISKVFSEEATFFNDLWDKTLSSVEEREVLRHLMNEEQPKDSEMAFVESLVNKEILDKVTGIYQFQIPLIRMFLEKKVKKLE